MKGILMSKLYLLHMFLIVYGKAISKSFPEGQTGQIWMNIHVIMSAFDEIDEVFKH